MGGNHTSFVSTKVIFHVIHVGGRGERRKKEEREGGEGEGGREERVD